VTVYGLWELWGIDPGLLGLYATRDLAEAALADIGGPVLNYAIREHEVYGLPA